jgi:anhydro-N-acetylmuramic acid kinase
MDAVDAVLAEVSADGVQVLATHVTPLPPPLVSRLRTLAQPGGFVGGTQDPIDELGELDHWSGEVFAAAALRLLASAGLEPAAIRAIGSHGQTLRHRPRAARPFTLQIGDPNLIAARTGIPVVADFRRRDMALGGQGAPLLPAFHAAVFSDVTERRAVLNLGGIANLTLLVPGQRVTGFDTGPANGLMDAWIRRHRQQPFDEDGAWAASGAICVPLLEALLEHPFLSLPPPKSTGPEDFSVSWLDERLAGVGPLAPAAVQATLCEFTAATIADALEAVTPERLMVCGGGVHNRHLLQRLAARLPATAIDSSAAHGLDPDHVEATAFAWLAARTLAGEAGNLPAVTGATRSAVLGAIYPGEAAMPEGTGE